MISSIIGTLTQYFIEKPLTTPVQAAVTCTQLNKQSVRSNLMFLTKKNALYGSLLPAITNSIPLVISHNLISKVESAIFKQDNKRPRPFTQDLFHTITLTTAMYPFTYNEIISRTKCCSHVSISDLSYAIPRPLQMSITPLYWNICSNVMYMSADSLVTKCLTPSSNTLVTTMIGSGLGTLLSYPFTVCMIRAIHNYPITCSLVSPRDLYRGCITETCKNVLLSSAHWYVHSLYMQRNTPKKKRTFLGIKW